MYKKIFVCLFIIILKILLEVILFISLNDIIKISYLQLINYFLLIVILFFIYRKLITKNINWPKVENVTYGLKMLMTYYIFYVSIILLLNYYSFIELGNFKFNDSIISFLNIVVFGSIVEELLYRGIFASILIDNKKINFKNIILITVISLIFSLFHFEYNINFIFHFSFSFFITIIYIIKKDLFLVTLIHILFNFLGTVGVIDCFQNNKLNLTEIISLLVLSSMILLLTLIKGKRKQLF